MAHNYNWVVQMFSNLPLVAKIETFLQSIYVYFCHFPNKHMELAKLAKKLETKGWKIICNVMTKWISMHTFAKRVLEAYKPLVFKVVDDSARNVKNNNLLFCECDTILGLTCVLPMMEVVQTSSKMAKGMDIFVCHLHHTMYC
jgi:hypothetical protein